MKSANLTHAFRSEPQPYVDNSLICTLCDEVLDAILVEIRNGGISQDELHAVAVELCTGLVYESLEVCEGAISSNIVSTLIMNK